VLGTKNVKVIDLISSHEQAELNTLFNAAFASLEEGILVYTLQGVIVHANVAALQLFGVQAEEVLGKTYRQFIDALSVHNSDCQLPAADQYGLSEEEPLQAAQQGDIAIQTYAKGEIHVHLTSAPLYNQEGNLIGGYMLFHDISAQHEKECRALQAFTSLLTLIERLVSIPGQEQKTCTEVAEGLSPIHIAGQALADVIAQVVNCRYVDVFALSGPDERQHLLGTGNLTFEQTQRLRSETEQTPLADYVNAENIARLHANEVVLLDLAKQPYVKSHSSFGARYRLVAPMVLHERLIGLFIIAKMEEEFSCVECAYTEEEIALAKAVAKLTALVIAQVRLLESWATENAKKQALQELNKHYDEFISIASHELRTPLTTIKGNVELALRRLKKLRQQEDSRELQASFERIQVPLDYALQRSQVQERMISELLDASRIQVRKLIIVKKPCNLVEIVRNAVADARQAAPDRSIQLTFSDEDTLLVEADADRIGQVLLNYLTNALKYSEAHQPVFVTLAKEETCAKVSVRDHGPGLTPEAQAQVWKRFYRVPGVEVQYGSGTGLGLGLFICREIIESHDGEVGVDSQPGEGSTFWFTLPLATL
jgi:PAS domain S-box-containing protein